MATLIDMPKLSDTMTVGTLVKWLKKEGDEVANGDMIAEVETDKATMEVECFDDGVLLKQYCGEGEEVAVGGPIAAIGEKGEDAPEVGQKGGGKKSEPSGKDDEDQEADRDDDADEGKSEEKAEKESEESETDGDEEPADAGDEAEATKEGRQGAAETSAASESGDGKRVKASPLAKKIAAEKGIDLSQVKGTGPGGRIVKEDVLNAKAAPAAPKAPAKTAAPAPAAPAATLEAMELPVSNMRKSIAKALVASKTEAPHFYLQIEVDGAPLSKLRAELNAKLAELPKERGGTKFTVNDLTLKAAAEAVRRVPAINRSWEGSKIVQHGNVHLAFGVAVDEGLVTPVIRAAETKGLRQIGEEAKLLIKKARDKKLTPDEMSGSTLTVTNLGMFGISDFYGIINPKNAAILSIGATIKRPVVDENDQIVIGQTMKVGLSGDHRVIDGAVGAQYLQALKEILETPALMLV